MLYDLGLNKKVTLGFIFVNGIVFCFFFHNIYKMAGNAFILKYFVQIDKNLKGKCKNRRIFCYLFYLKNFFIESIFNFEEKYGNQKCFKFKLPRIFSFLNPSSNTEWLLFWEVFISDFERFSIIFKIKKK